jgi:hypothetical protein
MLRDVLACSVFACFAATAAPAIPPPPLAPEYATRVSWQCSTLKPSYIEIRQKAIVDEQVRRQGRHYRSEVVILVIAGRRVDPGEVPNLQQILDTYAEVQPAIGMCADGGEVIGLDARPLEGAFANRVRLELLHRY